MAGVGTGMTHARLGYACDLPPTDNGDRMKYINVVTPGDRRTRVNPLQCIPEVRRVWVMLSMVKK